MKRSALWPFLILIFALPLQAAQRERPKSADLSEPVAASPYHWRKMSEVEGCMVYWSRVAGTKIVAYRVEGILDAPLGQTASLFLDKDQALPGGKKFPLTLKRELAPGRLLRLDLLKPGLFCGSRDFITLITAERNPLGPGIVLSMEPAEDPQFPPTEAQARGKLSGKLSLLPMTLPDQTYLRAEFHCEMGGEMPDWVANLLQQSWPLEAFLALQDQVARGGGLVLPVVERLLTASPASLKRKNRKPLRYR